MFCLVISLFRHKSMNGGEYLKMRPITSKNNEHDITPSISQITIENNWSLIMDALTNKINANLLFSSIVNKAAYDFGKRALEKIGRYQYTFISASSNQSYLYLPKHISDACLDLFGIAAQGLIDEGFAGNECDNDGHIENGELYSTYSKDFGGIKYGFKHIDEWFIPKKRAINYKVFIEFVYDSIIIKDRAYVNVHMLTNAILKQIINSKDKTPFYIFRYYVDGNGYVHTKSKRNQIKETDISIEISDYIHENETLKSKFSTIIIPSTKGQFKRDEGLFFTRNSEGYDVQIEHSEGLGAHKSNIVDFVVRNISDKDKVKQVLKTLGYRTKGTGDNEKFIWYAKNWPWSTNKKKPQNMDTDETKKWKEAVNASDFNKWSLGLRTLYQNFGKNNDLLAEAPVSQK